MCGSVHPPSSCWCAVWCPPPWPGGTWTALYKPGSPPLFSSAGLVQRLRGGLSWARRGGASSPAGACLGTPPGGAGGGTCSAAGCMGACVAVHGWLQVVLGALLPLAVMWAVEERSRLRFQQQWLQHHVVVGEEGGDDAASSRGGATSASGAQQQRSAAGAAKLLPPVPGVALAAWLAASSWALWRVFEILVL